jgi:glycosyltransferase involved in cell wall biosynthesis
MKILFIAPQLSDIGGLEKSAKNFKNLALGLCEFKTIENYACKKQDVFRKIFFSINALLKSRKSDFIICWHINYAPVCAIAKRLFGIKFLVFLHGLEGWNIKNSIKISALKESKFIITISSFTKKKILEKIPELEKKIIVVNPGVNEEIFKPRKKQTALKKRFGITSEKIILTVSRMTVWEKNKGILKVINSIPKLEEKGIKVKYFIVGEGELLQEFKNAAFEKGVGEKVVFIGKVSDNELINYYNLCDLFVMPSKKEGFGLVFTEAAACGKPSIGGNKDGSTDSIIEGKTGILIDPDNQEQLVNAIEKTLNGKEFNAKKIRKEAVSRFGKKATVAKIKKLFSQIEESLKEKVSRTILKK